MNKALDDKYLFRSLISLLIVDLLIGFHLSSSCPSKTYSSFLEEKTIREIYPSYHCFTKICSSFSGQEGIEKIKVVGGSKEEVLFSFNHPELVEECLDQKEVFEDDNGNIDNSILLPRISIKTTTG